MKIYLEKRKKNDFEYFVLYADLGYRKHALTFDKNVIAEFLAISLVELYSYNLGVPLCVGEIYKS